MRPQDRPERRCLKLARWPNADRAAWEAALRPLGLLNRGLSPAARWRPATQHKNRRGYGRWLTFLIGSGRGVSGDPAGRVTPAAVGAYLSELADQGVAPYTRRNRLGELHTVMRLFAPDRDWRWLGRLVAELERIAREAADPTIPDLLTSEIVELCLTELAAITRNEEKPEMAQAVSYRDWLMMALMAVTCIRRGNYAAITIKGHLRETLDGLLIDFGPTETKTHRYTEHPVPHRLEEALLRYITVYRPLLFGTIATDRLWLNRYGRPMNDMAVYRRLVRRSRQAFAIPINPHAYRAIAASSIAIVAPEAIGAVPALLGHSNPKTAECYYLRASSLSAARRVADTIRGLRESLPVPEDWYPAGNTRRRAQKRTRS